MGGTLACLKLIASLSLAPFGIIASILVKAQSVRSPIALAIALASDIAGTVRPHSPP